MPWPTRSSSVLDPTSLVLQAFTRNNCDRKDTDGLLERLLQGNFYGVPGSEVKGKIGQAQDGSQQQGQGGNKGSTAKAAQALSTFGGAALAADGGGREIVGMFPSDGIFF